MNLMKSQTNDRHLTSNSNNNNKNDRGNRFLIHIIEILKWSNKLKDSLETITNIIKSTIHSINSKVQTVLDSFQIKLNNAMNNDSSHNDSISRDIEAFILKNE